MNDDIFVDLHAFSDIESSEEDEETARQCADWNDTCDAMQPKYVRAAEDAIVLRRILISNRDRTGVREVECAKILLELAAGKAK